MDSAEYALMDAAETRMWWYRALHIRLVRALDQTSGRILDAGCGTGGFLARLATARPDLIAIGLEYDRSAASRTRSKSNAAIVQGTVNTLPFRDASFNAVIAADILCHAAVNPGQALAELHRVLRPGGRLVINMPAYQWLLSAHDRRVHNVRRQTARETAGMLRQAGFTTIKAKYWNTILFPLMIAQRKIFSRGGAVSDVAPFPPWLDATLHGMTAFERRLPFPLPFGGSVLATAEKS